MLVINLIFFLNGFILNINLTSTINNYYYKSYYITILNIGIYTNDYEDIMDVFRVLMILRNLPFNTTKYGVLNYKTDEATYSGIYTNTINKRNKSKVCMYTSNKPLLDGSYDLSMNNIGTNNISKKVVIYKKPTHDIIYLFKNSLQVVATNENNKKSLISNYFNIDNSNNNNNDYNNNIDNDNSNNNNNNNINKLLMDNEDIKDKDLVTTQSRKRCSTSTVVTTNNDNNNMINNRNKNDNCHDFKNNNAISNATITSIGFKF